MRVKVDFLGIVFWEVMQLRRWTAFLRSWAQPPGGWIPIPLDRTRSVFHLVTHAPCAVRSLVALNEIHAHLRGLQARLELRARLLQRSRRAALPDERI
jgi:hypothetical protein